MDDRKLRGRRMVVANRRKGSEQYLAHVSQLCVRLVVVVAAGRWRFGFCTCEYPVGVHV